MKDKKKLGAISRYPLQVLAREKTGCGLSVTIGAKNAIALLSYLHSDSTLRKVSLYIWLREVCNSERTQQLEGVDKFTYNLTGRKQ
ncbi:MAG: hypothetical protein KBF51_13500 [Chitinophagales bacterium]|nr:hypothetical protein [Chitinophagales bacterium]MBP9190546.1 hypothetical protein [Chitinophagales bacterium]